MSTQHPEADFHRGSDLLNPSLIARYVELAYKVEETFNIRQILPDISLKALQRFNNLDLQKIARIAEHVSDFDVCANVFLAMGTRQIVSLPQALSLLRRAMVISDDDLTNRLAHTLEERVPIAQRSEFQLETVLLRFGPEKALDTARAQTNPSRSAHEAVQLGRLLMLTGACRLASRYFSRCAQRWPNKPEFKRLQLDALINGGQPECAKQILDNMGLTSGKGLDGETGALRVRVLLALDALPKAYDLIQTRREMGFWTQTDQRNLIRICLALGHLEEAEELVHDLQKNIDITRREVAHFRITLLGALLNEAKLYRHTAYATDQTIDDTTESQLTRAFYYPAMRTVDTWMSQPNTTNHNNTISGRYEIPTRIFQYWNSANVPDAIKGVMASWQKVPNYLHTCFNRSQAIAFLQAEFGDKYVRAFRLTRQATQECDFLRLCYLLRNGGIYADADDKCIGDLDKILALGSGVILFREPFGAVINNFICARPGHPLLEIAVKMVLDSLLARENDGTWFKTGPGLLTRATATYLRETPREQQQGDIRLLPLSRLRPHVYPHISMPYKSTPKYWNRNDGAVPKPILEAFRLIAQPEGH